MTTPPEGPRLPVRRALISVYDKTGLEALAAALHGRGIELVSTGSTAARIAGAGIPVVRVEDVTGSPECLEGRVKTLHPRVHAGILGDLRKPGHVSQLNSLGIEPFGLVVVNLYPFAQTVASGACADECVEQIDIGGPSMVRAAAKNHPSVAVLTDPGRYAWAVEQLAAGGFTLPQRERLARDAFQHTAAYDVAVATWMTAQFPDDAVPPSTAVPPSVAVPPSTVVSPAPVLPPSRPPWLGGIWGLDAHLRYGENPHQDAAVYSGIVGVGADAVGLPQATQLGGKDMSFNNYVDADAAWR
ncbi:MAG: bifunctional phosphoribosylaminoimidazolecarboxamide formyltransferase/IMP cyclohydrolase, partial [Bifidobacteriaceae bacterium]|nr:bifunctional phosphoribosylaminoimidazolecarboxamide formyltransferase/IMP cyclohydrolase [Bifidobacteriaceae bacterium]